MLRSGRQKVLIVDDEPDICHIFGRILVGRNLRAEYAHNLAEANSSLLEDPAALILLDNNLPDGSGLEWIPYLKAHYPETQVILVTAHDEPADREIALQMGADDFWGKPLSLELINQTLDSLTERYLSERFPGL